MGLWDTLKTCWNLAERVEALEKDHADIRAEWNDENDKWLRREQRWAKRTQREKKEVEGEREETAPTGEVPTNVRSASRAQILAIGRQLTGRSG